MVVENYATQRRESYLGPTRDTVWPTWTAATEDDPSTFCAVLPKCARWSRQSCRQCARSLHQLLSNWQQCPYLLVPISDRGTSDLGLYTTQSDFQLRADGYRVSLKAVQYLELIKVVQYFNLNSKELFCLKFKGSKCPKKNNLVDSYSIQVLSSSHSMYSILFILSHSDKKHRLSQSLSQSKLCQLINS